MSRLKTALKNIFNPPPVRTLIFAVIGFSAVLSVPVFRITDPVYRYVSYAMSAYALVITITGLKYLKPAIKCVKESLLNLPLVKKLRSTSLVSMYIYDVRFRTRISLHIGLTMNIFYIILKLYTGIKYRSTWFLSLALYYLLLAAMRLILVRYSGSTQDLKAEFKHYRRCGIILLLMNQALTAVVTFIVYQNRGFDYPGYLIYAMAFYSFYAVITASVNIVKMRKHESPVMSAAVAVNFVAALVSLLSLTTAMLSQFDESGDMKFRRAMTASVGGVVCTVVILMAVYMIRRANKNLKRLKMNIF